MHEPHLIIMCGLAFSGKTTVARRIAAALDAVLISLDDINDERGLVGGDGSMTDEDWLETHALARQQTASFLAQNHTVVLDDTFSHKLLRDEARALAQTNNADFSLIFVETPQETIEARRAQNATTQARRSISDAVFRDHVARFQWPLDEEQPCVIQSDAELTGWLNSVS